MARKRMYKRPISEINVVPYIDVMLVLLVIFMITAPLLTQGVKVELPRADAEPLDTREQEPLVVTNRRGRQLLRELRRRPGIAGGAAGPRGQGRRAAAPSAGLAVVVRGDESVPYGDVVVLMSVLQRAGAPSVGLMTETPHRQ